MKVQNIAAMLDEKGIPRSLDNHLLSGKKPTRKERQRNDWPVVENSPLWKNLKSGRKCKRDSYK